MNRDEHTATTLATRLEEYRTKRVVKNILYQDKSYTYHVWGTKNRDAILLLPGGSGTSEPFFDLMYQLGEKFRCITLDYPALETMSELAEMIATMVKAEALGRIHLLGQSMGGMVAQVLLNEHPDLVDRIILCHTTTSSEKLNIIQGNTATDKEKDLRLIQKLPHWLLRAATRFMMSKTIRENNLTEAKFWRRLFRDGMDRRSKAELIAPIRLITDFLKNHSFDKDTFKSIAARTLIIDSAEDKSFTAFEKQALCEVFPNAQTIHFEEMPHLGLIEHRDQYLKLIEEFIPGVELDVL